MWLIDIIKVVSYENKAGFSLISPSTEKMTFLPRGRRQWRLSTQTRLPQRTTRWHQPTLTTAATGTTPNPTMTPTPTLATTETRVRPSPPLPTAHTDTGRPRTPGTSQLQARYLCPVTLSPQRQPWHRSLMAATRSRPPRLWWSPQTLPRPLPPWCAAMALWALSRRWRPHTGSTRTRTPWARPRWSEWARCLSWCRPRAERARWFETWLNQLYYSCSVWNWLKTMNLGWSSLLLFTTVFLYVWPLYPKTNWTFTVWSSINANLMMDRTKASAGNWSSPCQMCRTVVSYCGRRGPGAHSGLDPALIVFYFILLGESVCPYAWPDKSQLGFLHTVNACVPCFRITN